MKAYILLFLLAVSSIRAASPASVGLLWDASPDASVTGYALYYSTTNTAVTNRLDVGPALSTTVSNLTEGTTYAFFVVAYNSVGTESLPSNTLEYTPQASPEIGLPVALALAVSTTGNAVPVTLLGTDPQGLPLTYVVTRQPIKGMLSGTVPNLVYTPITGATGSDGFSYKVNNGVHDSMTANVTISLVERLAVVPPLQLLWDASPDASVTGYALYYGALGSGITNRLNVGLPLTVAVSNLTAGSTYFFFVVAYNAAGTESDPSNVLIYSPTDAVPPNAPGPARIEKVVRTASLNRRKFNLSG